jgi:hypothetical protein
VLPCRTYCSSADEFAQLAPHACRRPQPASRRERDSRGIPSARAKPVACRAVTPAHLVQPDGIVRLEGTVPRGECTRCGIGQWRRDDGIRTLRGVIGLMWTCRTVYTELAGMFYGRPVFRIVDPRDVLKPAAQRLLRVVRKLCLVWHDGWWDPRRPKLCTLAPVHPQLGGSMCPGTGGGGLPRDPGSPRAR